jgi:hypothetical protein
MFFKPKWFSMLRQECRPPSEKVKTLESLRQQYNIPHEPFSLRILSSPSTTRQLQRHLLGEAKAKMPNADERELWGGVLISRLSNLVSAGFESPKILEEADDVVRKSRTFDEICDYIAGLDQKEPSSPDPFGIGKMIDDILRK